MCRSEIESLKHTIEDGDNSNTEVDGLRVNKQDGLGVKKHLEEEEDTWSSTDQSIFKSINLSKSENSAFNSILKENLTLENDSFRSCDKMERSEYKVTQEES